MRATSSWLKRTWSKTWRLWARFPYEPPLTTLFKPMPLTKNHFPFLSKYIINSFIENVTLVHNHIIELTRGPSTSDFLWPWREWGKFCLKQNPWVLFIRINPHFNITTSELYGETSPCVHFNNTQHFHGDYDFAKRRNGALFLLPALLN